MALVASAAFGTLINGQGYTVTQSCTLTVTGYGALNVSANLVGIDLDCQNNTDLPEELRAVEGESVLGGTVTVKGPVALTSGATWQLVDLLNPDNSASPFYRRDLRGSQINVKFGAAPNGTPELLSKLDPGVVTAMEIDHADGTVALSVADLSAVWKSLKAIPSVVTAPPYNSGLTSEFVMDALIRTQWGDSTWPKTRPNCILSVGMRASLAPEIGTLSPGVGLLAPRFATGPNGSGLVGVTNLDPQFAGYNVVPYTMTSPIGTTAYLGFETFGLVSRGPTSMNIGSASETAIITARSTGVTIAIRDGALSTTTLTISRAIDDALHRIEVVLSLPAVGSTAWSATVYLDGVSIGSGSRAFTTGRLSGQWVLFYTDDLPVASSAFGAGLAAVQVTTETAPTITAFTPRAVIDPSLNPLVIPPPIEAGTAPFDECSTIAAAELGYFRVDEKGVARFSNRTTLANRGVTDGTTPRVVSASNALKNLTTSVPAATGYNHIQVPYTPYTFGKAGLVWTLDSPRKIGVGQTVSWVQSIGDGVLAANMSGPINLLPSGHTFSDGANWARYSVDSAGVNPNNSTNVTGNVVQLDASTVKITISNRSGSPVYLVSPSSYGDITVGTLSLWIGGMPITSTDGQMADVTYGAGDSLYAATSNPYLQDEATARTVAGWLLNQLLFAIRDFEDVDIVPDPRIQIGDLIRLQSTKAKLDEYARVWGWSFSASGEASGQGTWTQTLNVRALGPPGAWLGAIPGRSEGGVTTYGYG